MAFASGREGADRPARIGWHVAQARERTGISLGEAAAAAGISIAELEALEAGWRPPGDGELERLADVYGIPVDELLPPRTPVVVDPDAGTLGIGSRHAPLSDTREDALSAYLEMIYEARGVPRGEKIPLRDEDLDVLAGLVGDDPDEVEAQLIELMDYTPEEARRVRALLFRRKILAGAAGVVLGLGAAGMMLGQSRAPGTPVAMEDAAADQSSDPAAGFTPWGAPGGPPATAPSGGLPDTAAPVPGDSDAGDPAASGDETPAPVVSAPPGIDIGTALVIVAPPRDDDVTDDLGHPQPPVTEEAPNDVPGDPGVDTGGDPGNDTPGGGGNDNPGNDNPGGGGNDTPASGNDDPGGGNENPGGGNDDPGGGNDIPGGGNDNPGGGGNDTPGGAGNDNPGGGGNDNPGGGNDNAGGNNPGGGNDNPGGNNSGGGNQDGKGNGQGWGVGGTPPAGQQPAGGPHSA